MGWRILRADLAEWALVVVGMYPKAAIDAFIEILETNG